jgi:hypothetical protein
VTVKARGLALVFTLNFTERREKLQAVVRYGKAKECVDIINPIKRITWTDCGRLVKTGVRSSSTNMMKSPVTVPASCDFAPDKLLTAEREKEPVVV